MSTPTRPGSSIAPISSSPSQRRRLNDSSPMTLDWDRRLLDIGVSQHNVSGDGEVTANPTSTLLMQNHSLPTSRHDDEPLSISEIVRQGRLRTMTPTPPRPSNSIMSRPPSPIPLVIASPSDLGPAILQILAEVREIKQVVQDLQTQAVRFVSCFDAVLTYMTG